ncbi:energy-coupling factor transporter transmembrane component T family protein [Desulfomonile tiedjei]|uniref:energy-coupling factor transporter transmembrane component T family protein n=1 Tax=Desulfomonile tiedjei TaxID=2358 RepID=UPI0012FBDB14|nr:energy-coupling factor transporter transmembrane component T [Desulfomonile tiedjei]
MTRSYDIFIGSFVPGTSVLHRLDPRTKLAGLLVLLTVVFSLTSATNVAVSLVCAVGMAVSSKAGYGVWMVTLRRFKWMLFLVLILNILFVREGAPVTPGNVGLPFTYDGLERAAVLTIQLTAAIVLSMSFTLTTSPLDITKGFSTATRRFRNRFPVDDIGIVLLLAMRFIPLLQQEVRTIVEAQKARGVEFGRGRLVSRASNLAAVLVPALSASFRRADTVALAMTARGFEPGRPRSEFRPLRFSALDMYAGVFIAVYAAGQIILASQS